MTENDEQDNTSAKQNCAGDAQAFAFSQSRWHRWQHAQRSAAAAADGSSCCQPYIQRSELPVNTLRMSCTQALPYMHQSKALDQSVTMLSPAPQPCGC